MELLPSNVTRKEGVEQKDFIATKYIAACIYVAW